MRSTKHRALWPGSGGRWQNGAMIEDWLMWDNQSPHEADRVSPVDAQRLTRQV